jgi:peptide/nickel transport system permease protein
MRILPGDPLVAIFGPEGMTKLTEEQRASYMSELGLSDPLWVQYLRWVKDILRGNFGQSFFRSESVADMILRRGPLTAEIALISVVLSWLVGIPVAIISALKPNTVIDSVVRFVSILFIAVPGFWVGMLIVLVSMAIAGVVGLIAVARWAAGLPGATVTLSGPARAVPALVVLVLVLAAASRRRWPYLPRAAELPIEVERTVQGGRDDHRGRAPPGGAGPARGGGARDLGPPDLPGPGQDVRRPLR